MVEVCEWIRWKLFRNFSVEKSISLTLLSILHALEGTTEAIANT